MTRSFSDPVHVAGRIEDGHLAVLRASSVHGLRRGLRGKFSLGVLFVMIPVSYAIVFVLFDMWFKGG